MAEERRLMRTYARKTSIIVLLGVALTGCTSAEWNSIHRSHQLGDDQIRTLISDAKQRIVLTKNRAEVTNVDGSKIERVVCAEPSPDVAQAVSSSISAAFEKTGAGGQGLSVDAAAKFGESVAQLGERMAVIQLIRDKMYRACEAYANGAVDKAAYTLMLARLDKTMVTLLSQEMAAGAFGRALAVAYSSPGGADPAAIDKLKAKIDTAIDGIGVKEDEQAAQKTAAKAAATELSGAAKAGGGGGASGSGGGSIGNRPSGGDLATAGKTIHAIYRDYVDDDGTEPLVDACLVSLSELGIKPEQSIVTKVGNALAALFAVQGNDKAKEQKAVDMAKAELNADIISKALSESTFAGFCVTAVLKFGSEGYIERRMNGEEKLRILEKTTAQADIRKALTDVQNNLKKIQECLPKTGDELAKCLKA